MQAHTEVVLDGLSVGLFSVSHGIMAKVLFRVVVVAASRLHKPMKDNLCQFWVAVDSSVIFQVSCLTSSAL